MSRGTARRAAPSKPIRNAVTFSQQVEQSLPDWQAEERYWPRKCEPRRGVRRGQRTEPQDHFRVLPRVGQTMGHEGSQQHELPGQDHLLSLHGSLAVAFGDPAPVVPIRWPSEPLRHGVRRVAQLGEGPSRGGEFLDREESVEGEEFLFCAMVATTPSRHRRRRFKARRRLVAMRPLIKRLILTPLRADLDRFIEATRGNEVDESVSECLSCALRTRTGYLASRSKSREGSPAQGVGRRPCPRAGRRG